MYAISFSSAQAVDYTFTKIADTSGGLSYIYTPVLNESGDMVFSAEQSGGGQVLYSYSGGLLTTVVETTSVIDSGVVSFRATLDAGGAGIYTYDGGTIATVADTDPFRICSECGE